MQQRKNMPRILSAAALALLFGSAAVQADDDKARSASRDSGSTSASSSGTSGSGSSSSATAASDSTTSGASTSGQSAQARSGESQLSKDDQKIMRELAEANLAEIATARIALERSQNPQIKQFAQQMIDDHTKSQQQLQQLADSKGVQLPNEPARKHKRTADKLADLDGEKFDREYHKRIGEKAHEDTHKLLERAQKNAKDRDLQALVAQTLPVVEKHLDMAENMEGQLERRGRSSGDSGDSGGTGSSGEGQPQPGAASGSSAAPSGASGASMQSDTGGASSAEREPSSGTSSPSSNMRGPRKQQ